VANSTFATITAGLTQKRIGPIGLGSRSGGWVNIVRESFPGAFQRDIVVTTADVLAFPTVYRCINLISSDVAKLRVRLVQQDSDGIWSEVKNPAYSPVLRKPNRHQTRIQFFESWMISKLTNGNTYVLKQRDGRNVVTGLFVLDPTRVEPLLAPDGSLFYRLEVDEMSDVTDRVIVPAREMIHDRMNPLHHPLIGVSPIYAAGLAASQGRRIQEESWSFFANGAKPGGFLHSDEEISQDDANAISSTWASAYSGANAGKVAVLADGLKYQAMSISAHDSQLIEQLKWSSEVVCQVFGVPAYKAGVGTAPANNTVEASNQQYYSDCLQTHFEHIELLLDEGLGCPEGLGTEFDLDDLLRLDSKSLMEVLDKSKGKLTVNEQRRKLGQKPVKGGDTVYLQEQDHSLEALAKRDARDDPFAKGATAPPATPPANDNADDDEEAQAQARAALDAITKGLS
jgi:HK97 family phage portal protein